MMIQEEMFIFLEVTVPVIVGGGEVHVKLCLILNFYRDRTVWIYTNASIVNGNKEIKRLQLIWFLF